MVKDLKSWVKEEGLKSKVKVSKSSCLGHCESGITACIYPQNEWFHELEPKNLQALKNMLAEYAESSKKP